MALTHNKKFRDSGGGIENQPDLTIHDSVADTLRLARQEHGQDLRTVAQILRIRLAYLEAIEAGDFEALPGTAYAIGFLRTYAEFLGLDGDEIVERFKHQVHGTEPKLDLVFPEPVGQNRIPGGAIILISAQLLGLAYGGWFYLSNEGKSVADLIPPLPERLQAMLERTLSGADEAVPAEMTPVSETAQTSAYTPPESAEADSPAPLAGPADPAEPAPAAPAQAGIADFEMAVESESAVESEPAAESEPAESVAAMESTPDAPAEPESAAPIAEQAPTEPAPAFTVQEAAQEAALEAAQEAAPETAQETAQEAMTAVSAEVSATPAITGDSGMPVHPEFAQTTFPQTTPQPATPRQVAALTAPASGELSQAGSASVAAIEPLLDETVVIPAPPVAPQTMGISTDRSPRIYGESNEGTRVVLRAVQDSWVQIRDNQGALLLTRVLRVGDMYYVPQRSGLTLLTGNAGGLEIAVDGVTVSPLGPIGAVRRQIALDPTRLLDGTAQPR